MYQKLSKEEKKDVRMTFKKTNKGDNIIPILNRLVIEGIVCFIMAIIMTGAIIFFDYSLWLIGLIAVSVICGVIFILAQRSIRLREYNKFIKLGYKKVKNQLTKKK